MNQTYNTKVEVAVEEKNISQNITKAIGFLINSLQLLFFKIVKTFAYQNPQKIIIVGQSKFTVKLLKFFASSKAFGYQLKGVFDIEAGTKASDLEEIKQFCLAQGIDQIYFAHSTREQSLIADLSQFADQNFMYFRIATEANVVADKAQEVNTYYFNDVP
ncbi:MAG: hypothetical protein NW226_08595, partial [Microscillaceae bacterium]|nr:hypothetical protein [Microscillaceae bacterium]